jgi:hypothetical protein
MLMYDSILYSKFGKHNKYLHDIDDYYSIEY